MNADRVRKTKAYRLVESIKASGSCPFCGTTEALFLDFHHLNDGDDKKLEIARLLRDGAGLQRVIEEVEKCILVCSNDHRLVHAGRLSTKDLEPIRVSPTWLTS